MITSYHETFKSTYFKLIIFFQNLKYTQHILPLMGEIFIGGRRLMKKAIFLAGVYLKQKLEFDMYRTTHQTHQSRRLKIQPMKRKWYLRMETQPLI